MVRWKVLEQTAAPRPLELPEVVETRTPQSEQPEMMERQKSELREVLPLEQLVLRH